MNRRQPPILLLIAACVSITAYSSQQAPPAARLDPVEGIVEAFKSHQVVMLPGGHGSQPFHDLLLSIARFNGDNGDHYAADEHRR